MEAPEKIQPRRDADYLDVISRAVFQTGISWSVVAKKWPDIRAAFHDFDPGMVAAFSPDEIDALCADSRVIRNRRKIEATVANAGQVTRLSHEHGGFKAYLRTHDGFDEMERDLRKRFKFLGEMGAFYVLYVVGEPVPSYEDWCASRSRTPAMATG